jgi:hypothetical protein
MEGIKTKQQKTPPWRKKNPRAKHSKLSPELKQAAKTRAAKAGRPYPNLIDNMWAAQRAKASKTLASKTLAWKTLASKNWASDED